MPIKKEEGNEAGDQIVLCIIPFLLHLATNQIELFIPIVDKALDTRTIVSCTVHIC